jgi:2-iminobutanoate/2-iminopropanoate deaminase
MTNSSAKRQLVAPANAAKPVGPYSPGILAGEYLFLSGQGARDAAGTMAEGVEAQAQQCLENVKAIVDAAGLNLKHIVHLQLYLEKMETFAIVDRVYADYFPDDPPARVVIGVTRMPVGTPVEMTALAVRDLSSKEVIKLNSLKPLGHASSAIAVANRVYLSAVYGQTLTEAATGLAQALSEAGLVRDEIVFHNEYATSPEAMIPVQQLPAKFGAAISAIALRGESVTGDASAICRSDGEMIYCAAQTSVTPGVDTIQGQVQSVMNKLQVALQQHGTDLAHAVVCNIYLDNLDEFKLMNDTYAAFFKDLPPTRTTVQPFPSSDRTAGDVPLVRISLWAIKGSG